jgi:hypothetical protein
MNPKSKKESGRSQFHKVNEPEIEEEIWKKPAT